jgi:hypothetical protein
MCELKLFATFYHLISGSVFLRTNLPSLSSYKYILSFYLIATRLEKQDEVRPVINKWIESRQGLAWHDDIHPEKRPQPGAGKVERILFDTACCSLGVLNCDVSAAESSDKENSEVQFIAEVFKSVQSRVKMDQLASEAEQLALR